MVSMFERLNKAGLASRQDQVSADKPILLMVSHVVPQPFGPADSVRAWQWLRLAGRTHRVLLACAQDGPVNLLHWRVLHACAGQVVIEPIDHLRGALGRLVAPRDSLRAVRGRVARALQGLVREQARCDAVVATHPGLWSLVRDIPAAKRFCDVPAGPAGDPIPAGELCPGATAVTVGAGGGCELAGQHPATLLLPPAVEAPGVLGLSCVDSVVEGASQAPPPVLGVVYDGTLAGARAQGLDLLRRLARPLIRAVGGGRIVPVDLGQGMQALRALATVDVVALPRGGADGWWPLLQMLALERAVIAPWLPAQGPLRRGEHLFVAERPEQWLDLATQLLRWPSLRRQLALSAGRFTAGHSTIDHSGHAIRPLLAGVPGPRVAARAA